MSSDFLHYFPAQTQSDKTEIQSLRENATNVVIVEGSENMSFISFSVVTGSGKSEKENMCYSVYLLRERFKL